MRTEGILKRIVLAIPRWLEYRREVKRRSKMSLSDLFAEAQEKMSQISGVTQFTKGTKSGGYPRGTDFLSGDNHD